MMATSTQTLAAVENLAGICGAEHVGLDEGLAWVAPATTAEVAAVLRYAHARGVAVNPCGGGTKQGWCGAAAPSLVVRMGRMKKVLEHPWQDMTCTVEAGCVWDAMQAELRTHGQFVALDPLFAERASVGGICAANDSGSLRLKYGSLRDLIIGMTIVLADGTIAKTGGKVVKNVAGYDLHKLMTGAFGTLGIITEVTFRLHSIPRHVGSFTVSSSTAEPLGRLLLKVIDSHLSAQRMQLRSGDAGFYLDVQLSALPEVMAEQAVKLEALAVALGEPVDFSVSKDDVWDGREKLFAETDGLVVKATMMPAEIAPVTVAIAALGGKSITQATGVMTAWLPERSLLEMRKRVEAERGSVVVLQQRDSAELERWGTASDALPLMREVKQMFDPKRILNPGRYVGGI